jgi:hypothetical protein
MLELSIWENGPQTNVEWPSKLGDIEASMPTIHLARLQAGGLFGQRGLLLGRVAAMELVPECAAS